MFATATLWLTSRFGSGIILKIVASLLLATIAALGVVLWLNHSLTEDNAKLTEDVAIVKRDLIQARTDYKNYQDQVARAAKVVDTAEVVREVVKIKTVEVIREVIKYRDNPNVRHVELSAEWVCHHNASTELSVSAVSGETDPSARSTGANTCNEAQTTGSVSDADALEVVVRNNARYAQLVVDYNELLGLYQARDGKPKDP